MTVRHLTEGRTLRDALDAYRDAPRPARDERPWVLANMVAGIDGSTAIDGRVGRLSGPVDRALFVDLRSVADVVLVGAETVRRERYGPVRLSDELRAERVAAGRAPLPRLAVVSRSLRLDPDLGALRPDADSTRPLVLTGSSSPAEERSRLAAHAEVVDAGDDGVEPALALATLRARGVEVVLCEGGPSLLGGLLDAGAVDELCLTVSPLVGGDPLPVAVSALGATVRDVQLEHVLEADGHLFLRYLLA